ncbi:MAG: zf-HC2 domain-containing protein [Candidatus Goldbacteria bacterium]|nr:zf-HC2 domain-containing protein [Candidatus Goldiibacteriota bacterium]
MKKECKKAREFITLLIDNKISENDMLWLDKHFSSCVDCEKEFKEVKKTVNSLKILKNQNVPSDFYFKLNKAIDEIEAERKNKVFFPNVQVAFRTGLIFAVVILGVVVTMSVVKNNQKFVSYGTEKEKTTEFAEVHQVDNVSMNKDKIQIDDEPLNSAVVKKTLTIPSSEYAKIKYETASMPFNLISSGGSYHKDMTTNNRIYMQPIPAKNYYDLNQKQIQDEFDYRVYGFVVDNKGMWEKIRGEYNIEEFPEIDFQSEMMILVIARDNFSLKIVKAFKEVNEIIVLYRIDKLNDEKFVNVSGNSKNYDFKVINKTQLPVVFKRAE